jgi:hypothetical protein
MRLFTGLALLLVLGLSSATSAQQPAPAGNDCPSALRVEQELSAYTKLVAGKVLSRADKAEQALAQAKQDQERMEEELARVRQLLEDRKTTTQPSN